MSSDSIKTNVFECEPRQVILDEDEIRRKNLASYFAPSHNQTRRSRKTTAIDVPTFFKTNWSERLLVTAVLLRYGTMDRPAKPIKGMRKVAAIVGKSESSLWRKMKMYEETGKFFKQKKKPIGTTRDLKLEKKLCAETLLQEWAPYSLRERLRLIELRFNVTMSYFRLHSIYKRNKVSYKRALEVKRQAYARRFELDIQRHEFAFALAEAIAAGEPIIYQDESQFNSLMAPQKNWSLPGKPVLHVVNKERHSFIVYGAIGTCLKEHVFRCLQSTRKECFNEFVKDLVKEIKDPKVKPILVMDNHKSHYAIINRQILDDNFRVMWLPGYTSRFNSIEQVWGLAKAQLRRNLLSHHEEVSKEKFKQLVLDSFTLIGKDKLDRTVNGNRAFIHEWLSAK